MGKKRASAQFPAERIVRAILFVRGERVMLDEDLASLYGVSTGRLNEQVSRNLDRFPEDFSFRLTREELGALISQTAISKPVGRGGRRKLPRVFTEHGILMLSSVLRSDRAVQVNIEIMRAFVRLRQLLSTHEELARKLAELEKKYDARLRDRAEITTHFCTRLHAIFGRSSIAKSSK